MNEIQNIINNLNLTINTNFKKNKINYINDSADTLLITKIFTQSKQKLLIVARNIFEANRIQSELDFFAPDLSVEIFHDNEVIPYERISPSNNLTASRINTLWNILNDKLDIVIIQGNIVQNILPPPSFILSKSFNFKVGDHLSIITLKHNLIQSEYVMVEKVMAMGEFAIRGGIIDLMLMGQKDLIRIELFHDEIESLKYIDIDSNKTISNVQFIQIFPTKEYPIDKESLDLLSSKLQEYFISL